MTNHRTAYRLTVLVALLAWGCQADSQAQLTDYTWNSLGGGSATWQSSNWTQTGAANASPYPNGSFTSGNLSVGLASSLTLNVDGSIDPNHPFVTVGPITMGGTGSAVTTNIAGINNGYLLLKNDDDADFNGDLVVDGQDFLLWQKGFFTYGGQPASDQIQNSDGDADADRDIDSADLARWEVLYNTTTKFGNARITSGGVAGSVNTISAPIRLSAETLSMAETSTNDLTLSGEIRPTGGVGFNADTPEERGQVARIRNQSTKTLFITGAINTIDPADGTRRRLFFNDGNTSRGKIHITSTASISGNGIHHDTDAFASGQTIVIGSLTAALPLTTVQIDSANPNLHGKVVLNSGNLILGNDLALGDPNDCSLVLAGSTGRIGFNILSTDDSRKILHSLNLGQPLTIKGEHSLEWAGPINQSNSRRGFINILPAGKTLTLSGRVGANNGDPSPYREFVFDGSGATLIKGGLNDDDVNHDGVPNNGDNDPNDHGPTTQATYIKRGSGVVKVSGTTSKFRGKLIVEQGNLHFDRYDHLAAMRANDPNGSLISSGGAVGLDTTSLDANFILLFSNSASSPGGADTGGFMLAAADSAAALNFQGALAQLRLMTVAAPETGMSYTGVITASNTGLTFRLGGGAGKLTIPNASTFGGGTLPNNKSLYIANGGEVHIVAANNIGLTSGNVEVTAKYVRTRENVAASDGYDGFSNLDSDIPRNEQIYLGTTLTASVLANGGVASSIGASPATADKLLIRGSTLKYVGGAVTTNRLFTIGTGGATIDASGTGAVDFNGVGALATEDAAPRIASNNSFTAASNVLTAIPSTANLLVGMTVTGIVGGTSPLGDPTIPANTTITDILSPTSVQLSNALPVGAFVTGGTVTFGNFNRTLTLTGANTGNNFLRPTIANASQGTVGITKRGAGKWILTGANTYTGPTAVEQGTLFINGNHSGAASAYTVAAGATLGGTGTLGGAGSTLVNSGTVAPGTSVGALTTGGSYTQNAGAKLAIEMTGGASFDTLVVNGAATLSGVIDVDLISFTPAVNQTFDILTASGGISTSGLTVTGDGNWTTSIVGNTLRLTFNSLIQAVPEPAALALAAIGMLMLGGRRRR